MREVLVGEARHVDAEASQQRLVSQSQSRQSGLTGG